MISTLGGGSDAVVAHDVERSETLVGGHEGDGVDVHVGRAGQDELDDRGNVLGSQGRRVGVDRLGLLGVAVEAGKRELGLADQPRLHISDAHAGARQVCAQVERELSDEGLGGPVDVASWVGELTRDRADVDDGPGAPGDHVGQEPVGETDQPDDVRLDHPHPVVELRRVRPLEPTCPAGVVDDGIRDPHDGA
jgi:hypothetical protein